MKCRSLLVVGSLLVSLFVGCSKQPVHSAWKTSESIVIEPGVSVGPVHFGMTTQQVVAGLGEPDQKQDGLLVYKNLGLAVGLDKAGIVHVVFCSETGNSMGNYLAKTFTGQTKEGVGIGASRAEVVRAYGNPTKAKSYGSKSQAETITYSPLGVTFYLRDDKVRAIAVYSNHDV